MKKLSTPFLVISVVTTLIGFSGIDNEVVVGLGKALGAVFFILFYLSKAVPSEVE